MYLSAQHAYLAAESTSKNDIVAFLVMVAGIMLVAGMYFAYGIRKAQIKAGQENDLRQLVGRYEQLAANTMDAQQRVAADVAELRARTASIEQILRTVE
jgi:flagellar basal body-associated protein FliL